MSKKTRIIIAVIAAVAIIAACVAIFGGSDKLTDNGAASKKTVTNLDVQDATNSIGGDAMGIKIKEICAYSGPNYEDGSNDDVSNVMQITAENTSNNDYQVVFLTVHDKNGNAYSFKLSSFMHGETLIALETNRAEYTPKLKFKSVTAENLVIFDPAPSTHPDVVALMANGNSVTVVNNSGKALSNIFVYYKNYDGETAVGGITYRLSVPKLDAGESAEISTAHFSENTSKFMFVTYEG